MANPFKSRAFRYGIVSSVITVAVIAAVFLLNAVLSLLFARYPLNIDLTENRIFEISEETENFLSSLDRDVTIYVLNTEDRFINSSPAEYFVQANEVIRKYSQFSRRVHLEYLDLLRNPGFGAGFPGTELKVNDILVTEGRPGDTPGGKFRVLSSADLFNIRSSYYGSYVASSRAEQAMTSALLTVTSGGRTAVAVTGGHGEEDISAFTELLRANAYEVADLNLMTGDIDPGTQALILAAPARDLEEEELRKIDAFLGNGDGRLLFYLSSAAQPPLPRLASFLAEWGIEVAPGVVFETDTDRILYNNPFIAFNDYAEENYSKNMIQKRLNPVIPQSRPLKVLFEGRLYRSVKTLVRYSPKSGIRPVDAPEGWQPDLSRLEGDIPVLALSSFQRNNVEGDIIKNHVLVCGSFLALNQVFLGSPNIANSGYFLDLTGTLAGRTDQIFIMDKTMGFTELGASLARIILLTVIFMVMLPLTVLGAGLAVWLRRRHK
ncbi:MAG: GldG family protein [Treponema sp.]|nr:GldG family protein [Treponema sp.]